MNLHRMTPRINSSKQQTDPHPTNSAKHKATKLIAVARRNQGILGLVVLIILSSLPIGFYIKGMRISLYSQYFWQWSNFANIFRQTSITGILAVGMTFVIITGGIELSVGSGLAFLGCIAALLEKKPDLSFAFLILTVIAVGTTVGSINGALVTKGKFQPFIATLAAMVTLRGLAYRITGSNIVTDPTLAHKFASFSGNLYVYLPGPFQRFFGTDQTLNPVPVFAVIFLGAVIVGHILLDRTRFGRHVISTGANEEATRLSGVNVNRTKITVYAINGALVGLAALMFTARTSTGDPSSGLGYELDAIAAAVVGGTSLVGGSGSIIGTLVGALFIGVLNNSLQLNNIDRFTALALEGPIILLAVALQKRKK